jgi:hypothetical protein
MSSTRECGLMIKLGNRIQYLSRRAIFKSTTALDSGKPGCKPRHGKYSSVLVLLMMHKGVSSLTFEIAGGSLLSK